MKRYFSIIGSIVSTMLVLIGAAGCTGDLFDDMFNYPGYSDRGEGGREEPGHGGDQPSVIALSTASALYYGSYYNDETDNIMLNLMEGKVGSDGYFTGKATSLSIDLLQAKGSGATLLEGTYSCSNTKRSGTFVPGYLNGQGDDASDDGSTLYLQNSDTDYHTYYVTDGTVTIKKKTSGNYSITASIVANKTEYTFSFDGAINLEDMREGEIIDNNNEANFPGSASYNLKAKALYNGDLYKGVDDYSLILYCGEYDTNGNFVSKGYEVAFDILTNKGEGKAIPSGSYTCTSNNFTAFHFLDGFEDEDGTIYPSYFYRQFSAKNGDYGLDLITDGTGTIAFENGKYNVKFYFKTNGGSYLINFNGPIEFIDNRQAQPSGFKEGRQFFGIPYKVSASDGLGTDLHREIRALTGRRTVIE